jgi:hypothetical protein
MNPNQHLIGVADIALDQRHVLQTVDFVAIDNGAIHAAVNGGKLFFGDASDQTLVAQSVSNQIRDRDDFQMLLFSEPLQPGQQCHRSVVGEDLTNRTRRLEAGQVRQIHRCIGSA